MTIDWVFRIVLMPLALSVACGVLADCSLDSTDAAFSGKILESVQYPAMPPPYRPYLTSWRTTTESQDGLVAVLSVPVLTVGGSTVEMAPAGGYSSGQSLYLSWELGPAIRACMAAVDAGTPLSTINVERLVREWIERTDGRPWVIDPEAIGGHLAAGTMRATYLNAPGHGLVSIVVPEGSWWPHYPSERARTTSAGTLEVDRAGPGCWWMNVERELLLVGEPSDGDCQIYHVFPW